MILERDSKFHCVVKFLMCKSYVHPAPNKPQDVFVLGPYVTLIPVCFPYRRLSP